MTNGVIVITLPKWKLSFKKEKETHSGTGTTLENKTKIEVSDVANHQ